MSTAQAVEDRAKFDFVRYANCWEDPLLLLGVMPPQARCLSIASAGDNSFSLLCGGAASVTAFDLNRAQLDLCELKAAAFRTLPHAEFLRFLGFAEATGEERIALYRDKVRAALAQSAVARYDAASPLLARGVVDAGKFESYFRIFANRILPLTHTRAERRELMRAKGLEERRAFFRGTWANMRYRLLFKLFFNKWVMGRLGRDPEFFRYVKKTAISGEIWKRAERAMSELPTEDNPYLRYVILGTFDGVLPHYARPENFELIRSRLDRIRFVQGAPAELAREKEGYSFFNLSDIFEYMGPDLFRATVDELLARSAPGAVFAYYNMMLPRMLTDVRPDRFTRDAARADRLFADNQAFFYGAYHVDILHS